MAGKKIGLADTVHRANGRIGFWRSGFPNLLGNLCLALFIFLAVQVILFNVFDLNIFDPDDFKSANARIPELGTRRVVDEAGVLTQSEIKGLTAQIDDYEEASKGQMAVLIIKSLHGDPIEEFSLAVAEKWKIGRKGEDNGVLLLLAIDDRENRLEIGYGLEGVINDARAGDIIRGMAQWLQSGMYAQAISYAVASVSAFVRHENAPEADSIWRTKTGDDDESRNPYGPASKGPEDTWFLVFVLGFLAITVSLLTAKLLIHPDVKKSVGLAFMLAFGWFALRVLAASLRSGGGGGGGGRSRSGGGGGRFGGGGASGRW